MYRLLFGRAQKLTHSEIHQPPADRLLRSVVQHRDVPPVSPGDDGLDQLQLPPQRFVLLVAPGDLQLQHGVAVIHQLADLRHRRFSQRLHDGRQLRMKRRVSRHVGRTWSDDKHRGEIQTTIGGQRGAFRGRDQRPEGCWRLEGPASHRAESARPGHTRSDAAVNRCCLLLAGCLLLRVSFNNFRNAPFKIKYQIDAPDASLLRVD